MRSSWISGNKGISKTYLIRHLLKTNRQRKNKKSVTGLGIKAEMYKLRKGTTWDQHSGRGPQCCFCPAPGIFSQSRNQTPRPTSVCAQTHLNSSRKIRVSFSAYWQPPLIWTVLSVSFPLFPSQHSTTFSSSASCVSRTWALFLGFTEEV